MGKKIKRFLAMALSFIMLATCCELPMIAKAEDSNLKFGSDGKFKIVIFSDVQDQYPVHQRVLKIMEQAIEREEPDLVVFLGDMTEINTKDVEVDYRRTVEQILGPVVEAGIPYSIVFGNHDNQSYYSGQVTDRAAMLAVWQSIGDCRTTDPDPELTGAGTCKVPIYASNGNDIAFNLWMVDSNSYQDELDSTSGYDNPHADQVAWMAANNDADVNSLVFQHIPMPENYNLYVEDENGEKTYGDKKYKLELKEGVTGTAGEFPATIYADDNTGEFATLKEMGNVLGVFTGHDHLNDYSGTYEGIDLTAVPGMTYFNYGDEAVRGYGVVELDEADLSTYEYNTIKFSTLDAEAGLSADVTYDAYDEVTYSDLKEATEDEYTLSGGHTFTYDATSPSYSAVFKFRWTAGSKPGFQFSFDEGNDGNISYPFGVWIKRADQVEPNGAWHLKPNVASLAVNMDTAVSQGDTYDIEFGRLKILTGEPQHVGQYYVYLKVNGVLIQEGYSNTDEEGGYISGSADCQVSNEIRFGAWGNGGDDKISAFVEASTEEYASYDVITYNDLLNYDTLEPLSTEGIQLTKTDNSFKYTESEEAATTHSVILKLRWTMETLNYFQIHLGGYGGSNNFAYRMNYGNWHDRGSGETITVDPTPTEGTTYDFEVARLMVESGDNAGKYYTYFKVNGEILFEKYVSADNTNTANYLSNVIYLGSKDDNTCYVSATPEPEVDPNPDAPYYDYDEITFDDLYIGDVSMAGKEMDGGHDYTYNATSSTYSMKLKFRWIAGEETKFTIFLDGSAYPFCFAVKTPNQSGFGDTAGPNGAWHLVPSNGDLMVNMDEPIVVGQSYDIEIGRLKVKNGENKNKYYVYWIVNDKLIQSYYYDGVENGSYEDIALSNIIKISSKTGNKFSAIPVPETYEAYDEITFDDLYLDGTSMSGQYKDDGNHTYTYNATSSTYSMKFKFRWTAGKETGFTTYLDDWVFPFCFCAKYPNRSDFGATAGANGAWHLVPSNNDTIIQMEEPIVVGKSYDIEIGRLKVATGKNAGKYYVYWKVNDELIQSYYYDGVKENGTYGDGTALSSKIIIASSAGNRFEAIPIPETFEEYDEITFDDLFLDGTSMSGQYRDDGNHTYTYNATSPSYSMKFKFRWTAGKEAGFTTYLDDWVFPFCFCAKYPNRSDFGAAAGPNGAWHLVPSDSSKIVQMTSPIVAGTELDIEIGRLKVKTGANSGKYYVYFKADDQLIQSYYYDGVGENGTYGNGTTLSNKIIIASSAGNKFSAIPIPETFEEYDEISFNDLYIGDTSMFGQEMDGSHDYTYNATSPTYSVKFKYRWTAGSEPKFTTYLDDWVYPFCFAVKTPNQTGFGAAAGENGAWHLVPSNDSMIVQMDELIVVGKTYDIEVGRLKVKTGTNTGKYYVYFMVNDELIQSYYYDGVVDGVYNDVALSNKIIISAPAGNKFTDYPFVEEYEAYDEIGFKDLMEEDGTPVGSQKVMSGGTTLKYNKTSPTGSVIFKYRWKTGDVPKFQMSFEKTEDMAYMFGAWLSAPDDESATGWMWLRPSYGPKVNLTTALAAATSYNVEFARLKVKNGPNAGKYYVYIKLDGTLIAEDYVAADIVDSDGNYTTDPGATACTLSNEIFFAFWGSEGNIISPYRTLGFDEHAGNLGDFDGDGAINEVDVEIVRKLLAGLLKLSDLPEGIADFNNDGSVDSRDLVAIKKYFLPIVYEYTRPGSMTLGMQEHLGEDESKTAAYIADVTATMGANAYRLSRPIHSLYYVTNSNGVAVKEENMAAFKEMVNALKAKGITEILYVTDSFLLPWDYADPDVNHNETVPNPVTEPENYVAWLTVNAAAFRALAQEFPEIKFFEPYNEINVSGDSLEKPGIPWDETDSVLIEQHKYSVEEKAAIMADLCWYITRAVRSVDITNQVTTPSIVTGTNSAIQNDFLEAFYDAIESGDYPTGNAVADKKIDNYFTIVNLHAYPDYADAPGWFETDKSQTNVDTWAEKITEAYNVVKAHNDGGSRVWLTETGMSTYHSDGESRDESRVANMIGLALEKLDGELTFIDTVIFYEIAEMTNANAQNTIASEAHFGLFYASDHSSKAYEAKEIAKKIYSFFHNGTTDYSALTALANRYK